MICIGWFTEHAHNYILSFNNEFIQIKMFEILKYTYTPYLNIHWKKSPIPIEPSVLILIYKNVLIRT